MVKARSRFKRRGGAAQGTSVQPGWVRWLGWLVWLLPPYGGASVFLCLDSAAPGGPHPQDVANLQPIGSPPTVWRVHTRHPRALVAALAQLPNCPPIADRFDPGDNPFPRGAGQRADGVGHAEHA